MKCAGAIEMAMELLRTYPYLITSLGALVFLGAVMAFAWPGQRKLAVLSGLLTTPFGFTSVMVVPAYWNPRRVCEFLGAGIEDLIFSFVAGGMVWLCASCPWRGEIETQVRMGRVLKGYLLFTVSGLCFVLTACTLGCHPMTGITVSFAAGAVVLLIMVPGLRHMAAMGGLAFTLIYMILVKASLLAVPGFLWQWTLVGPWGVMILGVPVGEIMWAAGYGVAWSLFLALLFQARISPQSAQGNTLTFSTIPKN